jgi:Calcineurin-like phosphoesterase
MQRTIIVGDVHGCFEELQLLLEKCGYARGDCVVLAGDLVAKGPDSQAVDDFALQHRASAEKAQLSPRREHLRDLRPEDWAYLQALPLFLRLGRAKPGGPECVVVHAGVVPGVPIEEQKRDNLLSLRSIDDNGEATRRLLVHFPWTAKWQGPESIVFGHDAVRGLQQHPLALGIDTGCVYGRALTAWILPEGKLLQVSARKRYAGR